MTKRQLANCCVKVLFDQGTPVPLREFLSGHEVSTAYDGLPAKEDRRKNVPMQRYRTSEEVAAAIAFLASEGAAYITCQIFGDNGQKRIDIKVLPRR